MPLLRVGEISEEEFWRRFCKGANTTAALPQESLLVREYAKRVEVDQDVVAIARSLREQGFRLAIMSNTIKPHSDYNTRAGIYDEFPVRVLSHEAGVMKPDPRIYIFTLEKLGSEPDAVLFVDDIEVNVKTAEELGLHGVVFQDAQHLVRELKKFGIALNAYTEFL